MEPSFYLDRNKFGLRSPNGNIIIEPRYDKVKDFKNGFASVCRIIEDKDLYSANYETWDFVDVTGNEMKKEFIATSDFEVNAALVTIKRFGSNSKELIDKKGNYYFSEFLPYDDLRLYNVEFYCFGFGLFGVRYDRRNGVRSSSTSEVFDIIDTNEGEIMSKWKVYSIDSFSLKVRGEETSIFKTKFKTFNREIEDFFRGADTLDYLKQ